MELTVKIDTDTRAGKEVLKIVRTARKGISVLEDEAFLGSQIPEGYMTAEQARTVLLDKIRKGYEKRGIVY